MNIYLAISIMLVEGALFIVLSEALYRVGKRKGAEDLLKLFLVNGYDLKVKAFREQNKSIIPGGIVFVGDSITQDYPLTDFFPNKLVYNRGIGGDTTVGLLKRLNESAIDLIPKQIVLLIGTNDFGVLNEKPFAVSERIREIILELKKALPATDIVLLSVYPVNNTLDAFSVGSRKIEDIMELNRLISTIPDVTYIDLYSKLCDESNRLNPKLTIEGLHINAEGYRLITNTLLPYLKG